MKAAISPYPWVQGRLFWLVWSATAFLEAKPCGGTRLVGPGSACHTLVFVPMFRWALGFIAMGTARERGRY